MRKLSTGLGAAFFFVAGAAGAHLTLTNPPARHPDTELKYGPCGVEGADARSTDPQKITTFAPGQTISVEWTEYVDHDPSHYRIAFSENGDSDFFDPTGYDDIRTEHPVLLDGIPDADAGANHQYVAQVTLPDTPCNNCTLQVIQVMHDKMPWGPGGGDDIYYQCADIVISEEAPPLPSGSGGSTGVPPSETGGGSATTGGADGSPVDPAAPGTEGNPIDTDQPGDGEALNDTGNGGASCSHFPGRTKQLPWLVLGAIVLAWAHRRKFKSP